MNKSTTLIYLGFITLFSFVNCEEICIKPPHILTISKEKEKKQRINNILSLGSLPLANKRRSKHLRLTKKDHLATNLLEEEDVCFLEGYIQALIDSNYYENYVIVAVQEDRSVLLYNLPSDERIKNSIISFVRDLPSIKSVKEKKLTRAASKKVKEARFNTRLIGVWFPETTVLFEPLIANPRDPVYSIAYRWGDAPIAEDQVAVSLGDIFPIYRFFDVFGGDLQIDIGACMWANFDMKPDNTPNGEWAELVTTDYLISIPISYARDNYSFRLRIYHISSHLGDEYMVNHKNVKRTNPSFEVIDFFFSFQFKDSLRLYAGPGFVINSDESHPMKVFYAEYGLEFRPFVHKYRHPRLYGSPFFALDCQNWEANDYRPSITLQLGYEWSKLERAGRSVRIFCEYHNGYSEGQLFGKLTEYWAIRGAWGF